MCILFIHVNSEPEEGEYRLILATNRDEYFQRPAVDAFWCDEGILGGRDMEPGREGGMWFGFASKISADGEKKHCIGTLLNLSGQKAENAAARGSIVKDYLKTPLSFREYGDKLDETIYSGYNLVAVELSKNEAKVCHHSNSPKIYSVYSGDQTLAFGNSPIYSPLTKVTDGRNRFEEIISNGLKEGKLVEELLKLLKDETSHLPDVQLQKRSPIGYTLLSSIFVKVEPEGYGTRAHTVVLIDHDWNMHFVEHAMDQPIDIKNPKWNISQFQSRL